MRTITRRDVEGTSSPEKIPPSHQTLTHTITLRQEDFLSTSLIMQEVVLLMVRMMSASSLMLSSRSF